MDKAFWQARWARDEIGFHQPQVNGYLERHFPGLALAPGDQVFVPLCGKSLDMLWLAAQGYRVLGVELSEKAVQAFFAEQGIEPAVEVRGDWTCYRHGAVALWCGDVFALTAEDLADCAALYDRAALIALPPALRERYAAHLAACLPATATGLLVTLDYPQAQMDGPPFAVPEAEVRQRLGSRWHVVPLESRDVLEESPRFRERGVGWMTEAAYRLEPAAG